MNSEISPPYRISLHEAASRRLANVERLPVTIQGAPRSFHIALPATYARNKNKRYPLVILHNAEAFWGSAIEMSRLMAETQEIQPCILMGIDGMTSELEQILTACRSRYRVEHGKTFLLGTGTSAELEQIATSNSAVCVRPLTVTGSAGAVVPALVHELRTLLRTGGVYGKAVAGLSHPLIQKTLSILAPLIKLLRSPVASSDDAGNPYSLRCEGMQRNFEIFVSLPESAKKSSPRRYPAVVVLDANIEFSNVAEAAARMAASGEIEEVIVIGIGVPRVEGAAEFAFRRFEEFSPPADGYDFNDELGRIFLSLFALARGQDARQRIGQAPGFYRFITRELLPRLLKDLPIDASNLGLLGHSAGGTFVGYALHQADSPFSRYMAISPGIAISGDWMMKQTRISQSAKSVYLTLGSEEKTNRFNQIAGIPATEDYCRLLQCHPGLAVHFQCFDNETHSSVYPGAVVSALSRMYPAGSAA